MDIDPHITVLDDRTKAQQQRLDGLLEAYSTGLLTRTQYTAARSTVPANLDDRNRQIDSASKRSAVSGPTSRRSGTDAMTQRAGLEAQCARSQITMVGLRRLSRNRSEVWNLSQMWPGGP